ncbi:cobalamin-binding protein [Thiomicrorhabdus aquaedulcis]|uniref:cobalamin-binding protein n=1 Tax=Thiomicrorhabdus aquaedulcis TaxID=2211106 RepID=UPI000FD88CD8|nr:cobalamin-binding protein [Thiomicrorhabdus aquaedulcis]
MGWLLLPMHQAWSNPVQTTQSPTRIISLAPHITELLFSAGAGHLLVGAVDYSDYPPAAKAVTNIGRYDAINLEKIIQLQPDLILAWDAGNRPKDLERLEQLGFKVHTSTLKNLNDIPKEIKVLGKLINTNSISEPTAQRLETILQQHALRNKHQLKLTVFYQIWNEPLMTINQSQFIGQIITLCGAHNSFADLPTLTPTVSIESVIARNPNVILLGGQSEVQANWLKAWQQWPTLDAVAHHRIHLMHSDTYQRPTARLIDGIEDFCNVLYSKAPLLNPN